MSTQDKIVYRVSEVLLEEWDNLTETEIMECAMYFSKLSSTIIVVPDKMKQYFSEAMQCCAL